MIQLNNKICGLYIFLAFLMMQLSSCLSKENPVPLKPQGNKEIGQVEMGEYYPWQIYYSLKNNTLVGKNLITAWDLGFENGESGWHVITNSAKIASHVYKTNKTDLSIVTVADTVGIKGKFDLYTGNLDSTAVGDWKTNTNVYILDRGTDENGTSYGYMKFKILSVTDQKYIVAFDEIDGTNAKEIEIIKDDNYNFSYLSFNDRGKTLLIEPPKTDWDIVFSKYTYYYVEHDLEYSVTGCLLNRYKAAATMLDTNFKDFEAIDLSSIASVKLNPNIDAIGFDWKYYDFDDSRYNIRTNQHFLIRSGDDEIYYKLRFVDFYKSGVKGAPEFEYQRL
jgi:hypothetical protein